MREPASPGSVTLIDGTPLNEEQKALLAKLQAMIKKTSETGQLQTVQKKADHDHHKAAMAIVADSTLLAFCDPWTCRRYLAARQWNVEKAYEALMGTLYWRANDLAPVLKLKDTFSDCTQTGYMQWIGTDREGHPALFITSRNANLDIPRERRLQYLMISLEKGISLMSKKFSGKDGLEQWNMIIDETDKEMKHMDNKFIQQITPIMFSHYVERLRQCYVINPGLLTQAVLSIVKMSMDDRTKKKMHSYYGDKQPDGTMPIVKLIKQMGEENVPIKYGGLMKPMSLEAYEAWFNDIPFPSPDDEL